MLCKLSKTFVLLISLSFLSCTSVKTEHHITLDHNITIKIEKEVNDFLNDLYDDEDSETNE
ncbi:MAG: hypothetical protein VXZ32_05865 [Verrucomicrobiota bacterium]|nr:hypothetical protein [Verrucomicrobiota bacterium]